MSRPPSPESPTFRLPRPRDDTESMQIGATAREVLRERLRPEVTVANLEWVYGRVAGEA
jgi:hypothetical protein